MKDKMDERVGAMEKGIELGQSLPKSKDIPKIKVRNIHHDAILINGIKLSPQEMMEVEVTQAIKNLINARYLERVE